jgi:hypothetical protein
MAALAFLGHGPGLWLIGRYRLGPKTLKANGFAWLLTFAGMGVGYASAGLWALVAAWMVGHVVWGTTLSVLVYRELARR